MKSLNKYMFGLGFAAISLGSFTSCIDETVPANGIATEKQVGKSSTATEAMVMAMPAYCHTMPWSDRHNNFGYGSFMHIRDLQTGDAVMEFSGSGYDSWFTSWSQDKYMGQDYFYAQYQWIYHWRFMQAVNNVIAAINPEAATTEQLGWLGSAFAYRAMLYLDLARMYEFLPNDKTSSVNEDGNDIAGLTVPIVKAGMSEADARNNPRVKHEVMAKFIEEDLNEAEKYVVNLKDTRGKILPDLACTYGLKARLYMWDGQYAKAQEYARKAIDASGIKPMSKEQCLNTTTGFNVTDPWMWGAQQTETTGTVTTGIVNWTSWVCNETEFGYASAEPYFKVDKRFYDRISDTDFRKLEFKAPASSPLASLNAFVKANYKTILPDYASLKFRPGNGNADTYSQGAATAYPLMRVEEMYFIEAEAAAQQNPEQGKTLLETFMKTYRDPSYTYQVGTSKDEVIEEIVFQKRVELWGEGQSFFDIKRLNYSVTRGYKGTTVTDELARLNTNGRPAWMNWVISLREYESNEALVGMNNPDPSDKYTPWVEEK
jgi:tetratricopeptide (TPR) repeat protein